MLNGASGMLNGRCKQIYRALGVDAAAVSCGSGSRKRDYYYALDSAEGKSHHPVYVLICAPATPLRGRCLI